MYLAYSRERRVRRFSPLNIQPPELVNYSYVTMARTFRIYYEGLASSIVPKVLRGRPTPQQTLLVS